jgi:RNase H-fold protein (predicted Holliday junction resolvase)
LLSVHRTKQNDYEAVALVVHETVEFEVLVVGAPADVAGTDAIFSQILATVEFTR